MGISLPEATADFSKQRTLRIVVLAVNAVTCLLGLILMISAAGLAIRTDANGQLLVFTTLLGAAFFVVSGLGICGVVKYDFFLYIYFVVTLFIAVMTLFATVYVAVNAEDIQAQFESNIMSNWGEYYANLGTDIQGSINDVYAEKGYINCAVNDDAEANPLTCCDDAEIEACEADPDNCSCDTWLTVCIDVDVFPQSCYDEVKSLVEDNLTVVAICCVAVVLLACLPLGLVVKIMGFHEIVKHSQLITTTCLAIVAFFICIAGGAAAGYATNNGLSSIAGTGYVVLVFGAMLLITCVITLIGHMKGISVLQLVSTICFAVLAVIFLALFIVCFAGQGKAAELMAEDCDDKCDEPLEYCWMDSSTYNSEDCVACSAIKSCPQWIYYDSQFEVLEHLLEEYADCQEVIGEDLATWLADNTREDEENAASESEICDKLVNAYNAAEAFYGDDYDAWSATALSYMTQTGYVCAFTFLFCFVQVGSSYYITRTSSELQE